MRKTMIAAGVAAGLCVAAGGGYVWVQHAAQARVRDAAAAIRAGLGPAGSLSYAAAAVHPLSRDAELTDVALRLPSGPLLTAGRLVLTDGGGGRLARVHAERLRLELPGAVGTADTLDGRDVILPPPVPGQPYRLAPEAVLFGAMTLAGIAVQAGGGSAQLASLEVGEYGAGRHSTVRAASLVVPLARLPGVDRAGFDAVSVSGLGLAELAGAVSRGQAPPPGLAAAGTAALDGLFLAQGDARPLRIASMRVVTTPGPAGASASTATIEGLVVEPVTDAMRAALASMGLPSVQAALSWSVAFDAAGGRLTLSPLRLGVAQLGTLLLSTELAHVDPAALAAARPDPAATMGVVAGMQLVSAHVALTDAGLLDRVLALGAQRTGMAAPQLRAMLAERITQDPAAGSAPRPTWRVARRWPPLWPAAGRWRWR